MIGSPLLTLLACWLLSYLVIEHSPESERTAGWKTVAKVVLLVVYTLWLVLQILVPLVRAL